MTHHCPPHGWNKTSVLFLILLVTFLCLPAARVLGVPPTLTNICIYQLGAEILLTWEFPGADYYKVYSAEADRWWRPVRTNLTVRWFRDNDYLSLPGYYQVAAYNTTGEYAFSQEILVTERKPLVVLAGVEVRPTPDNAMRLDCEVGYPEPSYPGTWGGISFPAPGGAAAMLEIGTSLSNLGQGIWNPEFSQSHSFLLTDLQPDTVYWYRLTCVGTNGAGFSYVNSFTPRAYVEPKLVTLTATPCSYCQVLETEEDTPIRFILTNEFAPVDLNCAYTIIRQPYFGQITGTSSEFLYTPNLEWCGGDGFAWALSCEGTIVASGEIAINPRPVNDPPIARDASFEGREDFPIQLLPEGYDFDWETVICNMVTGPTNGTIWSDPYHFVYMPKTNFTGMDHITFRASDGKAEGNIATIKIRVTPENDPPQAANMQVTATNNQHTLIHLAGSDVDLLVPGEVVSGSRPYLRYELVTRPQHGGAMFEWPNTIDYTPVNYTGPDSFIYRVTDGSFQAFATVYITVVPENHPPTASTSVGGDRV